VTRPVSRLRSKKPSLSGRKFRDKKLQSFIRAANSGDFVILGLACTVLIILQDVTDRKTDRQNRETDGRLNRS